MMTESEEREIRDYIRLLETIHAFHNEQAEKGAYLYQMTEQQSVEHRLDIMEMIAEQKRLLKEANKEP
ncbi:MAG: hypothetical protein LH606_08875 [Cytophagaceae bacterium]|nr:hypothetical protein [Cytophagaceae bacterium]